MFHGLNKKLQHETQPPPKAATQNTAPRQKLQHETQAPGRRNAPKRPKTVHFACSTVGAQMQACTVYNLLASKCCMLTFSRRRRSIGRACRVCQVCRVHITTRTEARVPGRCRGALRVMLPRGLGDAGQVGDCVKQIQYVRVFEHCWVHQAARRVGGGGSNPEPHTCF